MGQNDVTAEDFAERLRDDMANDYTHAWTAVPDIVTDYLKHLGYDGIQDQGGKFHEEKHTVYIPFSSEQVKSAEPVTYDDSGNPIHLSERFNQENDDIRYSERDYDTPSDLELMEQAAEGLTEAGSAAYWESLLQSAPDLAEDKVELAERARDYKAQAKKLEKVTAELAEAKRNLTLTNRKLNTKGIFPMVQSIMKDMAAGDVKGYVGDSAFNFCESLEEVHLPPSVDHFGKKVFSNCNALKEIIIPDGVHFIPPGMFSLCFNLRKLTLPESVTEIGEGAFHCCTLSEFELPSSVNRIGTMAFSGCRGLSSIRLPERMERIEKNAFRGSALRSISLPRSISAIEDYAFKDCEHLETVEIPGSSLQISETAFDGCERLRTIIAPCLPLSELIHAHVAVPAVMSFLNNPNSIDNEAIKADYLKYLSSKKRSLLPKVFGADLVFALELLSSLKKITVDNFEKEFLIPAQEHGADKCAAFLNEWRQNHNRGEGEKTSTKKNQGPYRAESMKAIWDWEKLEDGTIELTNYKGSETVIAVPSRIGKTRVSQLGAFAFSPLREWRKKTQAAILRSVTEVHIPEGICSLGESVFDECSSLTKVLLPQSVTAIGKACFRECKMLSVISLPTGLSSVGEFAFSGCKKLKNIWLPEKIKQIPTGLFRECKKLEYVHIPTAVTII